jgi:hypothetical protein
MAPRRDDQDSSPSRHSHRSRGDGDDASVDSGYGGSTTNPPWDKDALRYYHSESAKYHAESSRRSSRSEDSNAADSMTEKEEIGSSSDTDYDPIVNDYFKVYNDEHDKMAPAVKAERVKPGRDRCGGDIDRRERRRRDSSESHRSERRESTASERDRRERRQRRESDASSSSRQSDCDRVRERDRDRKGHKSASSRRHSTISVTSDSSERCRRHSSALSEASSSRSDSHDRNEPSSRRRRRDAQTASHSRHGSNYRSMSPMPPDSWEESEESLVKCTRRRRRTSRSRVRSDRVSERDSRASPKRRSRSRDESARHVDPEGEAARSFLGNLTKGVDMKSLRKVGLDAAAVQAIEIGVGTQVPWDQRIARTATVGAAAAIIDFVVQKTNFEPKGMLGTIYARQFVDITLANLIVDPVCRKITGAVKNATGMAAAGRDGAGDGKGRR